MFLSHDDQIECLTRINSQPVDDKRGLHAITEAHIAAFIAMGGRIQVVPSGATAYNWAVKSDGKHTYELRYVDPEMSRRMASTRSLRKLRESA